MIMIQAVLPMELIMYHQQATQTVKALCGLIKQKHECINKFHNNTLLHELSHTKQSETDSR